MLTRSAHSGGTATDPDGHKKNAGSGRPNLIFVASSLGLFFGVAILIGYLFGRWLDGKFHTQPWLSLVGVLIGVAAGFRELIRIGRRYQREQAQGDEE